jgi:hypothetical protein
VKFTFVVAWAAWCVVECAVLFQPICAIVHPPNRTCSNVPLETDDEGEQRTLRPPAAQ